jgi:RHS repeat-associated protein
MNFCCEYITQNGQTTTLTYLSSPDGLYALHRILPDGSENIHYLHTDHTSTALSTGLGSWTAVTDQTGTVVDEQSYDAWGNRRNPYTWRKTGLWQTPRYDRGFTGHEHLDGFQLINMNGRMYDPVVSRMLAPDNFVQTPDFSQNFNRYSYALNNPLMFTDPSGELFGIDDAIVITALAIIGAYTGGVGMNEGEMNPLSWDWQSPDTYFGIGFGALLGYVGGYGLVNPGTVSFALGLGSPAGGIYLAGNASDWNFEWSTAAGGGGSIDLSQPVSINDIVNGSNDRVKLPVVGNTSYWDGRFFHGTEEEARRNLVENSKFLGVETAYWATNKGYYFSPTRGSAYKATDFFGDGDWNVPIGYQENTISSAWRYEEVYKPDYDNLYILNPFVSKHGFVKVNYRAHTHPGSSPPSVKDYNHSYYLGYRGKVFGWNGVTYPYRGYLYQYQ